MGIFDLECVKKIDLIELINSEVKTKYIGKYEWINKMGNDRYNKFLNEFSNELLESVPDDHNPYSGSIVSILISFEASMEKKYEDTKKSMDIFNRIKNEGF